MADKKGMTLKGFVRKASAAKSAMGFLDAQKDYIRQHPFLTPTLTEYESGKVPASLALTAIRDIAFKYMVDAELDKAKIASEKEPGTRVKKIKKYSVTIFLKQGLLVVAGDDEGFDILQDAEGWADRRLFENASAVHAEIVTMMAGKDGKAIKFISHRQDAIARVLKQKKAPFTKNQSSSGGGLGFRPKVKNDHFYFSRG